MYKIISQQPLFLYIYALTTASHYFLWYDFTLCAVLYLYAAALCCFSSLHAKILGYTTWYIEREHRESTEYVNDSMRSLFHI